MVLQIQGFKQKKNSMLFSSKDLISEYVHGKGFLNCHLRVHVIEKKKMGFRNHMLSMENNDTTKLQ